MTPSMTRNFAIRPVKENRPVWGSKEKQSSDSDQKIYDK